MELTHLTDDQLLIDTASEAKSIRARTVRLLFHLIEIEKRRLFAKPGASSLFDYCVRILKMSESVASCRVNSARLLSEMPELAPRIATGELNTTSLNQAYSLFKAEEKAGRAFDISKKRIVVSKIVGRSTREVARILLVFATNKSVSFKERLRFVDEETLELRTYYSIKVQDDLQFAKDFLSHQMPGAQFSEMIAKLAAEFRERQDPIRKAERANARKAQAEARNQKAHKSVDQSASKPRSQKRAETRALDDAVASSIDLTPAMESQARPHRGHGQQPLNRSRYIHAAVRHFVWWRDAGCCTYVDALSGLKCESKHQLEPDHIVPFAMGGENTVENLRMRCRAHNQWHAAKVFGHHAAYRKRAAAESSVNSN